MTESPVPEGYRYCPNCAASQPASHWILLDLDEPVSTLDMRNDVAVILTAERAILPWCTCIDLLDVHAPEGLKPAETWDDALSYAIWHEHALAFLSTYITNHLLQKETDDDEQPVDEPRH